MPLAHLLHLLHLHWVGLSSSLVRVHRHRHTTPVVLGWWHGRGPPRDISKPDPWPLARSLMHHVSRNWASRSCPRADGGRQPSMRPRWRLEWLLLVLLLMNTRLHASALVLLLSLHPWPRRRHLLTLSARELPQLALSMGKVAPIAKSAPLR